MYKLFRFQAVEAFNDFISSYVHEEMGMSLDKQM